MNQTSTVLNPSALTGVALLGIAGLVALVLFIIVLVKAFRTSVGWGIVVLLLGSIGCVIFGIKNWATAGMQSLFQVAATAVACFGAWLLSVALLGELVDSAVAERAKMDIQSIEMALMGYERSNYLKPPTTEQGLRALVEKPASDPQPTKWRQYLQEVPLDPWGNEYEFRVPGVRSGKKYDLFSKNKDGVENEDDIGNW